jgi:uncharacterized membrane protein
MQTTAGQRLWEVDCLRGVAIVMMIIFHLMWDLSYFGITDVDVFAGFWLWFQRATATLFLLVVGVSLHLSAMRVRLSQKSGAAVWLRQVRRGLIVFGCGLLVTLATWLVIREGFVVFGILHLIGLSVILAYPFIRLGPWNALLGLACIAAGAVVQRYTVDFPWLVWLGLRPRNFYTVDYFPVLPWFGMVLLGLFIGSIAYDDRARRFALPALSTWPPVWLLSYLGRHSLLIYLIHQPVLIALLVILGVVDVRSFM